MVAINVQFSDSSETTVVAYFGAPQSESNYPNLGTVGTSDARWSAFYGVANGAETGLPPPTQP